MSDIDIKRVYEVFQPSDGFRVLVDRVWPRGMTKEKAAIDLWDKNIAPTTELRKWFGHDPAKWDEFQQRYIAELKANPVAVNALLQQIKGTHVTLLYGAKDEQHNQAVVLRNFLTQLSDL